MAESSDPQLLLKKRARRRLVGAVAFAGLAAIVLPMVMDEEPKQQIQDVQIRIPGQDQTPFTPKALIARAPQVPVPEKASVPAVLAKPAEQTVNLPPADKKAEKPVAEKMAEKSAEKSGEKPPVKTVEKAAEKTPEKTAKPPAADSQRAASILGGKGAEGAANGNGQYVILIGAFANHANVKLLQSKIGELGVKTFTEPLPSPQGQKTRVRAGPFANREAAEKALDRMKRIGVSGVVSAK